MGGKIIRSNLIGSRLTYLEIRWLEINWWKTSSFIVTFELLNLKCDNKIYCSKLNVSLLLRALRTVDHAAFSHQCRRTFLDIYFLITLMRRQNLNKFYFIVLYSSWRWWSHVDTLTLYGFGCMYDVVVWFALKMFVRVARMLGVCVCER